MRNPWIALTLALAVILTAAASTEACHRRKSGGGAGGGCGAASCGGQQASGGCASGSCAWVQIEADGYAWVAPDGRQLGAYRPSTGVYTEYLGGDRWGAAVALTPTTKPVVGIAAK